MTVIAVPVIINSHRNGCRRENPLLESGSKIRCRAERKRVVASDVEKRSRRFFHKNVTKLTHNARRMLTATMTNDRINNGKTHIGRRR